MSLRNVYKKKNLYLTNMNIFNENLSLTKEKYKTLIERQKK